ncbi:HEPN domain-containing protein [Microbacterium sp. DT81.1]|uniref:HEPN domain-containing protein n=1 Tax=Microbacterium sp. DT81.1 TaxID=3393413 RepID=UPI003CEAAFAA
MLSLTAAHSDAQARFERHQRYVHHSHENAAGFTSDVYASWILLAYASYEAALRNLGEATIGHLGQFAPTPADLPDDIRRAHAERVVRRASEAFSQRVPSRGQDIDPEDFLSRAFGSDWASVSVLLRIEKNGWVQNVREWLRRVGAEDADMVWMREPYGSSTETLESFVDRLVGERNDLAHGDLPAATLSADLMVEWIDAISEFVRRIYLCLQVACARAFPAHVMRRFGDIDPDAPALSDMTAAFAVLHEDVSVMQHALVISDSGEVRAARVASMQTESIGIEKATAGDERVAITFSRSIERCAVFHCF